MCKFKRLKWSAPYLAVNWPGVNPQTIGYLERGDYKPSLELARKIAGHFGVAVEMIFSLDRFAMTFGRTGGKE